MLKKLKAHWKVSGLQLFLILCVFAITGITTAWLSRQVSIWCNLEPYSFGYWLTKILVLLFGYQVIILCVSIPFGQFAFFWKYEKKILRRMGLRKKESK